MRFPTPRGRLRFCLLGGLATIAMGGAAPAGATDRAPPEASSRGSITITASVAARSDVSGLSDVAQAEESSTESPCIWLNTATHGFAVTARSGEAGEAFSVSDGQGRTIPYGVAWNGAVLSAGAAMSGLVATATKPGCTNDPAGRARLSVNFASPAPHAIGALSLLIVPE